MVLVSHVSGRVTNHILPSNAHKLSVREDLLRVNHSSETLTLYTGTVRDTDSCFYRRLSQDLLASSQTNFGKREKLFK